jgi:hypothetical protein
MSNHRLEPTRVVSTHVTSRKRPFTACWRVGAVVCVCAIAGACERITPTPTGPLPDCQFPPSTERCGHTLIQGPQRVNPF